MLTLRIGASVCPGPNKLYMNAKSIYVTLISRATQDPSVIWSLGEDYERNKPRFWRCGICKNTCYVS